MSPTTDCIAGDTPEEALKNAFGWTQYDGHGPGDELLGNPTTALELGFGRGHAVAALATKGVDISPTSGPYGLLTAQPIEGA